MIKTMTKLFTGICTMALSALVLGGVAYAATPETAEAAPVIGTTGAYEQNIVEDGYAAYESLLDAAGIEEPVAAPVAEEDVADVATVPVSDVDATVEAAPAAAEIAAVATASTEPELYPMSLKMRGEVIPYIDYFGASSAPDSTGGLWMGSDSTTDGSWGYFIGHHPGVFNVVMDLRAGDVVTVCDRNGNTASYTVYDVYDVANTTYWEEIEANITGHGESIAIQTCVGDGATYRIVQAA